MTKDNLYRTIWRWHFYAGLFVLPFIFILSVTGSIYLFKPQLDRWQESDWRNLETSAAVSADAQVNSVKTAYPNAQYYHYRLPENDSDAAMVRIGIDDTKRMVYVSPQGKILASKDPESFISDFVSHIHGSLLLGQWGSYAVELAASWTILLILSGLYLWWPRGRAFAGAIWPRLHLKGRQFWRDMHAVTGFWVSGLALVLLTSGLPWTDVWANGFKMVRTEMGWIDSKPQQWKNSSNIEIFSPSLQESEADFTPKTYLAHQGHEQAAPIAPILDAPILDAPLIESKLQLNDIVAKAKAENLPYPTFVIPPYAPMRFGPPAGADWIVTSETQNRPLARSISYNSQNGEIMERSEFADKHPIDRVIGYGIAWHEGQLLGWFNQMIGVLTALALIGLAISSIKMWWQRRPNDLKWYDLGAPPKMAKPSQMRAIIVIGLIAAALLPMIAISLLAIIIMDYSVKLLLSIRKQHAIRNADGL